MRPAPSSPCRQHPDCLQDPRCPHNRHLLDDIHMVALCALISGADSRTQAATATTAKAGREH
uniref:Transposase family protein n=1 Tax=Desulfobacca acetoxidans TaxID=60893 RepID=A0A7V6DNG8_9BACT